MTNKLIKIQEPCSTQPDNKQPSLNKKSVFKHVFFDLPFRTYFLLAPAFGITGLSLWLAFLNGLFNFNATGLTPVIWHIHEMTFGFAATIAVAFILTAAQTWTGKRSLNGKPLVLLIGLWITIRISLIINNEYSVYSAVILQAVWWLAVLFFYSKLVITSQNRRNLIFIPILALMAVLNLLILMADILGNPHIALHLSRSMILVFVLLMSLIGGRVIPFFTVRGASTESITTPQWLTFSLIIVSILGFIIFILSEFIPLPMKPAVFMIVAGVLHIIRLSYWRSLKTLFIPLLWSLHISYLFISIGLVMLGLSYYKLGISFSNALHLITIGAMSLMILAMMSRVSLGHTNRKLVVNKVITFTFFIMGSAALIRAFMPYIPTNIFQLFLQKSLSPILFSWNLSALLWILALLIFLKIYWPILTTAKN
jgi:uncharacterized protein involved in response to NO